MTSRTTETVGYMAMRSLQLVVVFAGYYAASDRRLMLAGWALYGLLVTAGCLRLFATTGSVLAARSMHGSAQLGSLQGTAYLLAVSGMVAAAAGVAMFGFAERARDRASALLLRALGASMMVMAIFSGRRQGLLADAGVAAILLFVGPARHRLALAALLFLAVAGSYQAGPLREFLAKRETLGSEFVGKGTGRLELAVAGYKAWLNAPWFGHGPGSHRRKQLRASCRIPILCVLSAFLWWEDEWATGRASSGQTRPGTR
jgi:hypothetical protein